VRFSDIARLPTRFGGFTVQAAREEATGKEHLVVARGEVRGREQVPVRIHSECLTGDVMGSLRCDCREQLERSLAWIERNGIGVLIYLRQEGRGIGLMNKIRAYSLQERGLDTVEANERLGFEDDHRDYASAVRILQALGIRSVALITNNPGKIDAVRGAGIPVVRRIPLVVPPNPYNAAYLRTKEAKLGHLFGEEEDSPEESVAPSASGGSGER
jgi:GTP cyclohydrolase II